MYECPNCHKINKGIFCSECGAELSESNLIDTKGETFDGFALDDDAPVDITVESKAAFKDFVINNGTLVRYAGDAESVVIPDGIHTVAAGAFKDNQGLRRLLIPQGVKAVEESAFEGCTSLELVYFDAENALVGKGEGNAFSRCGDESRGITAVIGENVETVPRGLFLSKYNSNTRVGRLIFHPECKCNTVGARAFEHQPIRSVCIPDTVCTIEASAFNMCTLLGYVELPVALTVLGKHAFNRCTSLESVSIPDGVREIDQFTFYDCTSLRSLTLGAGVSNIKYCAFANCIALETVNFNAVNMQGSSKNAWDMSKVFSNAGSVGRGITVNVGAAVTRIPPFLFNTPGMNEKDFVPPNLRRLNFEEGCACKEIGQRAFMNSKFKELRFPEGLENIGNDAFWGGSLISVMLPSTLKQIGSGAFLFNILSEIVNNSSLEINAGDEKAFGSIAKRADVLIHKGESFLQREGDYLFLAPEGKPAKLIGYSGEDDAPCLPDSFRGEKYIFGEAVFKRNEYITSMRIPGWLRVIPPSFCEGCLSLQRLEIEEGITEISSYAFEACNSLTSVILPRTVTKLGVGAFNCVSLRRIALSPVLESIGQWAFLSCKNLKEIYNPSQITIIKGRDDNGKISENAEMINSESPSVLRKGDFEFWVTEHSCNLVGYYGSSREIKLPSIEGKTYTVGMGIFSNMGKLASFDTGDSVSIIKEDAFVGTSFESFTLGASVLRVERSGGFGLDTARLIYAAERAEDLSPDDAWFCNVKEMTVRKNVKRIPANIMNGAFPLERIIFEEGSECASIGERAFYLTSIEEITVPQRIKSIGNEAFLECPRLSRVYFNAENMQDLSRDSRVFSMEGYSSNLPPLIELTVGRTVRRIPAYLFYGFDYGTMKKSRQLSDIVFESGSECEYIGVGAFGFQSSFSELMLPDALKTIDSDAFASCDGIESLTLPAALEKIGMDAFSGCKSIGGEIIIPESVSELGAEAFDGCTSLERLRLRARIEEIPPFFVGYCEGLRSVEIPEYVKIIGRGAFKDCKNLKELTLPGSLEKIETQAFFGSGIMRIMIGTSVTEIGEEAFVQSALKSAMFENPNGWKTEKALFSLKLNDPATNAEKLKAEKSKRWHRK